MRDLPTGTVTFLFTDIEGSTRLLQRLGDRYREVVDEHGLILREAISSGDGTEIQTEGDSFFAVFPSSGGVLGGDSYIGLDVHLAARIAAAGHGGQVLVSEATMALVKKALPNGASLRDLGRHRLKDIERPEHLYDLVIEDLPSEFPAIRTLDARPTNLPPQRTSFIGREREVAEVTSLLAQTRLLTLTGPGGTGKTRLALKVAADHLDRFSDGVFFADLSPIVNTALVPSVIAQTLLVREEPGRPLLDTLADHLRDRHALLVLDNSEQVIEAGLAMARLLDAAGRLTILATSRVPFHISGEREFHVPPLALPDTARVLDLDLIIRSEAGALFTERAAAVNPGFAVTKENGSAVAGITTRLDGLPLAIELAASSPAVGGIQRRTHARRLARMPTGEPEPRATPWMPRQPWRMRLETMRDKRRWGRVTGTSRSWHEGLNGRKLHDSPCPREGADYMGTTTTADLAGDTVVIGSFEVADALLGKISGLPGSHTVGFGPSSRCRRGGLNGRSANRDG